MVVSSADFDNVAAEIGESVTIYNSTQAQSSDYGSLTSDTGIDSGGTSETAIIQPETLYRAQHSDGRILEGDLFAMFRSDSIVTQNSLITRGTNIYKIKNLIDVRVSGSIHHYEANLEYVRSTA